MLDLVRAGSVQSSFEIRLLDLSQLKRTELHNPQRASRLATKIDMEGTWTNPLWVESSELLVMDGHHRLEAAILLGLVRLPCALLAYDMRELSVVSWNGNTPFPVPQIFVAGRTQALLPYKTTRHMISCDMPQVSCDLAHLR